MSSFSQFAGGGVTTAIVNGYETGGAAGASGIQSGKEVLSGALTANTFATILSITGSGEIPLLSCYTKDSTSRTLRMRVTVDGVVVFNPTASAAITSSGAGIYASGQFTASGLFAQGTPIRYSNSLLVEIASSLTETDKVAISYVQHAS